MRDATKISDYFYGAKTLFLIPLYQRNMPGSRNIV